MPSVRYFCSKPEGEKAEEKESESKEDVDKEEEATKENKDEGTEETTSSDEEYDLSKEDIKKIKQLINEQDDEIEALRKKVGALSTQYKYQLAENDNTVKRYKHEVQNAKEYAVSKFAKDLLEVRDDLQLAMSYTKMDELAEEKDPEILLKNLKELFNGVEMTSKSFDRTMKRFDVVQFNPLGEKFDPNYHEAMFMMQDLTKKAGTVGEVMQSGWKIGDRVL